MKKFNITTLAATLALALGTTAAQAAAVQEVAYGSLSGTAITFSELADGNIDGLLSSGGVQFGERFAGQELNVRKSPRSPTAQDWFDDLQVGSPTAGLTLLAGTAGANLGAFGSALFGVGPQNPDGSDPSGFGAVSARLAAPVSALGFQLRDVDYGAVTLSLYRLDGSLIQNVELSGLYDGVAPVFVAFARTGGTADIAGFSLTSTDTYYGVSIDNLVLSAAPVPEPASVLLLASGLLTLTLAARRRTANKT